MLLLQPRLSAPMPYSFTAVTMPSYCSHGNCYIQGWLLQCYSSSVLRSLFHARSKTLHDCPASTEM